MRAGSCDTLTYMTRILVMMMLVMGITYFGGSALISNVLDENSAASLILAGINRTTVESAVLTHYRSEIIKDSSALTDPSTYTLTSEYTHINQDSLLDLTAILESQETCGTGGCIATIFLQNGIGEFEPTGFRYAVRDIEVLESITNGMHDIRLNGDTTERMVWNGAQYLPESI